LTENSANPSLDAKERGCLPSGERSPLVSVVMATYNVADALELTIQSILKQDFKSFEIVVADGASKDRTVSLLQSLDQQIVRWISEPDKGIYDAFNKACRLVRGEWVLFMGAGDMLSDEAALARFASAAAQVDSSTEIIYGKVQVTDPDYNNVELLNRPWTEMEGRWRGGRPMIPHHQGVFHRRGLLSGDNPFDTTYRLAADSKVVFRSMARVAPIFMNSIVAVAPEGGVSTNFRNYLRTATEIIRVNQELNHGHYILQAIYYCKILGTYLAYRVGGEKLARISIATYRRFRGRTGSPMFS
jgi:glycosyltransferase involved in cell wall biosynthesis